MISNKDMPAMPQHVSINDNGDCETSDRAGGEGLTKREMIAMHISGHVMTSLNYGASKGEWEYPSFEDLAQQSVVYADALLKELEK